MHREEKIPLVLGITGHRNLHPEEFELIRTRLREVIQCLRETYPETPLKLLSPLAEGADRLVAHLALEEGLQLVAPLPFAKDDYCRDFKTQESLEEFNQLLAQADYFSLPQLNPGSEVKKSPERFAQYTLVGAYVARHSHVLLALWDGREQPNPGSTYEVIQFRLTGNMQALPEGYQPPSNPLDFVDTGKVCHIKVSRANDPQRFFDAGDIHILSPQAQPSRELKDLRSQAFHHINQFNRDVNDYQTQHGAIDFDKGKPFRKAKFEVANLSTPFQNMARIYELASFLSVHNHRPTEQAMRWIFTIGALMVLAVEFYAHPPWLPSGEYPNWLLGVYFGLFSLGYIIYRWANKRQIHDKYLHYRGLAEALRVQMFWQLGGLSESVADFYQRKHRNELEWIRNAVRALSTHNWVHDQHSIGVVLDEWIDKQVKYFKRRSVSNYHKMQRLHMLAEGLFLAGLGLAAALFLWGVFAHHSIHYLHSLHSSLIVLMVFLPAVGAVLDGYMEKSGFDAHFKRYREMFVLFERAAEVLRQNPNDDALHRRVLLELGKAALEENSDWLLLHRERPVGPPKM